ncbi:MULTISPECIES: DsrE family protein [Ramlibacter]|uniref:DsrE family protein n=1 Tax=Ramlibacter aquaticus TaxID=2780094 RepID=A0ABR9SGJ8_9BURK|nr:MULTISPECIES: DsrE family protein [Ramlibacter]MBE7940877.1 DsrE family protein [Ramlibacter aquaticus]
MTEPTRRSLLGTVTLAAMAVAPAAARAAETSGSAKPRLLIHVSENEPARWNMALGNAKNAQDEVGGPGKIEIEIVSNGPSVLMLKNGTPLAERLEEATRSGVKIVACENSMKGLKLAKSEMHPSVGYVPAGIVELMKKQQEGWAYVRP